MTTRRAIMCLAAALTFAALTGVIVAGASSRKAPRVGAFIRVNQLGYPAGAAKRAFLLSPVAADGTAFVVRTSPGGAVVASGRVGPSTVAWAGAFRMSTRSSSTA